MKRLPWKYVAGLVDGEGCIKTGFRKKKNKHGEPVVFPQIGLELTLTETSKHVIDMLHNSLGGKVYRAESRNPNWKPTYCWRLNTRSDCIKLFNNIVKHCYIKDQQIRLALWFYSNDKMRGGLTTEVAEALKDEFRLQKGDPQRLSEKAVTRIEKLML